MSVVVGAARSFQYVPPARARGAKRILVKPNLGYPVPHPVTVSRVVLAEVLRGLRKASPTAEILVVEGVCSKVDLAEIAKLLGIVSLLGDGIRLLDADALPVVEFPHRGLHPPQRFAAMWAPSVLHEVDCRISVGTFKRTILHDRPLISASLKNLYGLFPRRRYKGRSAKTRGQLHRPSVDAVVQDVYHCVGHLFDGAVVDATERYLSPDYKPDRRRGVSAPFDRIATGEDLLAVDQAICREAGEPVPDYLRALSE